MKDGNIQSLGAVETKLMYTLHWIILDAAEECADNDFEKGLFHTSPFYYLFSIPTLTVSGKRCWKIGIVHLSLAFYLFVRANLQQLERIRFSKFPIGKWSQNMAGDVGIQTARSFMLFIAL